MALDPFSAAVLWPGVLGPPDDRVVSGGEARRRLGGSRLLEGSNTSSGLYGSWAGGPGGVEGSEGGHEELLQKSQLAKLVTRLMGQKYSVFEIRNRTGSY